MLLSRGVARLPVAATVALLLAACGQSQVARPPVDGGVATPAPQATGAYKVGRPYQVNGQWYYPKVDYDYRETGIASWYGPKFHGKRTANGEIFDQNRLTAAHRTLPLPSMVRVTNLENGRQVKLRVNDRGPFSRGRIIDVSTRAAELLGFKRAGVAKVRVEIVEGDSRRLAALARGGPGSGDAAPQAAPTGAVQTADLSGRPLASEGATARTSGVSVGTGARSQPATPEADGTVVQVPVEDADIYIQAGSFVRYDNARRLSARLSSLGPIRIAPARVRDRQFFRVQLGPVDSVAQADRMLARLLDNGHDDAQVVLH